MTPNREPLWTIDELGTQAALALAENYAGQSNGSVRAVPDRRTIRYYTTLGLLDPPAQMRGRTALYRRRHLLQLVAIKRLQARGLALVEVQQRLLGRTDADLEELAAVPRTAEVTPQEAPPGGEDFWRTEPAEPRLVGEMGEENGGGGSPLVQGVRLTGEVTLLLETVRGLEPDDVEAIRVAAGPLLKLLEKRRLLTRRERGSL